MSSDGNVGLAFGLVCAAGAATCIGASVVFFASLAKPRFLAGSLGFAAGVMICTYFLSDIFAQLADFSLFPPLKQTFVYRPLSTTAL